MGKELEIESGNQRVRDIQGTEKCGVWQRKQNDFWFELVSTNRDFTLSESKSRGSLFIEVSAEFSKYSCAMMTMLYFNSLSNEVLKHLLVYLLAFNVFYKNEIPEVPIFKLMLKDLLLCCLS